MQHIGHVLAERAGIHVKLEQFDKADADFAKAKELGYDPDGE